MAVFECKMCGGDLDVDQQNNIAICTSCGTKQTVANADDEKKVKWINDANKRRIRNEFDQALRIYETVRNEFPDEAEAYWGICLCKYGIEYVDDPKTKRKIPTCHRSSFNSILQDEDYLNAVEKSDVIAKEQYQAEAAEIDRINRRIQEIANKEKPYDVFICYKETDENGERTLDSVRAQQVYDELVRNNYKVFFARITLEDKLGEEYEPYIFSALNSAKIMLVFGTKDEHFKATWVRNEWSRFLNLMEKDNSKRLYPCYANIDPYDLPVEFKHLQAQDMNKVGFEQDLVRNIEKVIPRKKAAAQQTVYISEDGTQNTLDTMAANAQHLLDMKNYKAADEIYTKISRNFADSYIGWQGKILCLTREFTARCDVFSEDFKTLYMCLDQTADEESLSEFNAKLSKYLKEIIKSNNYLLNKDGEDTYNLGIGTAEFYLDAISDTLAVVKPDFTAPNGLAMRKEDWDRANNNAVYHQGANEREKKSNTIKMIVSFIICAVFSILSIVLLTTGSFFKWLTIPVALGTLISGIVHLVKIGGDERIWNSITQDSFTKDTQTPSRLISEQLQYAPELEKLSEYYRSLISKFSNLKQLPDDVKQLLDYPKIVNTALSEINDYITRDERENQTFSGNGDKCLNIKKIGDLPLMLVKIIRMAYGMSFKRAFEITANIYLELFNQERAGTIEGYKLNFDSAASEKMYNSYLESRKKNKEFIDTFDILTRDYVSDISDKLNKYFNAKIEFPAKYQEFFNFQTNQSSSQSTYNSNSPQPEPANNRNVQFCPKCGTQAIPGDEFCPKCGNRLE